MAETVDSLLLRITADFNELKKELSGAEKQTDKSTGRMGDSFKRLTGEFRKSLNFVGKWVIGIGTAAAGLLSFKAIMDSMNSADGLAKTADRIRISTEELGAFRFAAEQTGASADLMDKVLLKISKNSAEAAVGIGEAVSSIRELGLDAEKLAGMPVADQFREIVRAFEGVEGQSRRTRLAMKLFGEEGIKVLNLVNEGVDGLEAYTKEAERLGLTLSRIDAARIEAANDALNISRKRVEVVAQLIASQLSPLLTFLSQQFVDAANNTGQLDEATGEFVDFTMKGLTIVKKGWLGLVVLWTGAKTVIGQLSVWTWEAIRGMVKAFMFVQGHVSQFLSWLGASFNVTWKGILVAYEAVKAGIVEGFAFIQRKIGEAFVLLGEGAEATRLKGVAQAGRDLAVSGHNLRNTATMVSKNASDALDASKDDLDKSIVALEDAKAKLGSDVDVSTPALDALVSNAELLLSEFSADFDKAIAAAAEDGTFEESLNRRRETYEAFKSDFMATTEALVEARKEAIEEEIDIEDQRNAALEARRAEFLARLQQQERDAQEANRFLWESGFKGRMEVMSTFFGQMSQLMSTESKKQFAVGKQAAISGAAVDTYLAATKAYQAMAGIPIVGPGLGAAAATAATLAGLANINRIRSTSFGGKGSGGGGSAGGGGTGTGAAAASSTQQGPTSIVNVGLSGERFSGQQVRSLIGVIQGQLDDNAKLSVRVN